MDKTVLCMNCGRQMIIKNHQDITQPKVALWIEEYICPVCGRLEKTVHIWECLKEGDKESR